MKDIKVGVEKWSKKRRTLYFCQNIAFNLRLSSYYSLLDMRTVSYRVSLGKLERIQFLCLMNCKEFVVCRPEFSIKLTDSLNSFESAELGWENNHCFGTILRICLKVSRFWKQLIVSWILARNKRNLLCWALFLLRIVNFICFLEESRRPYSTFEIYLPLSRGYTKFSPSTLLQSMNSRPVECDLIDSKNFVVPGYACTPMLAKDFR